MSEEGALTAPIADSPPAGAYASGVAVTTISATKVAMGLLAMAVVGSTVGVALTTRSGAQFSPSDDPFLSANDTHGPTASPTVDFATPAPTPWDITPTPPVASPPSLEPTLAPTVAPTEPTTAPTPNPTRLPTPRPTVDTTTVEVIESCAGDVLMYVDVSNSISQEEEQMEREFGQKIISDLFNYREDVDAIRVGIQYFAKKIYSDRTIEISDDEAADEDALLDNLSEKFTTSGYTFTWLVLEDALDTLQNPPDETHFNETTGNGLSIILLSDGSPQAAGMSNEEARAKTMAVRDTIINSFPQVKIFCFTPTDLKDALITFYENLCDGYWYIGEESYWQDAALAGASVTSKVCMNSTVVTSPSPDDT